VRRSWCASLFALGLLQGPGLRLDYRVRVVAGTGPDLQVLAAGAVSGPEETRLRFGLRTDTATVEALLSLLPDGDTVNVTAEFFSRRRLGRSRRGLPLWEEDTYHRAARLAWGDTARILPFGPRHSALRLELVLTRKPAGGVTRPAEAVDRADSAIELTLEAVLRPRRVAVTLTLTRGDEVGLPRSYDLVPDAPSRTIALPLGPTTRTVEISLARPEPPLGERDRVLALDADAVCLRVLPSDVGEPARQVCGRLNNVAQRLGLPGGDVLVATFAWPGVR
jgi:hypothetical protein